MSSSGEKRRLDQLVSYYFPELSRNRIQAEIMAGNIIVNGQISDKPGTKISSGAEIKLLQPDNPYVSRGGLKICGALEHFSVDVNNLTVIDIGASTGGFTDCLLQKGARLVYALDVGYGQLALKLRNDCRVVVMERFNVRNLQQEDLEILPDLAVVDVSFISLSKVIPVLSNLNINLVLTLVKPQFEVGKNEAGRGRGVIRDPELHRQTIMKTVQSAWNNRFICQGITYSPLPGPKGNIEYFILFKRDGESSFLSETDLNSRAIEVVQEAHSEFFADNS